jgi:hypothetical protein
VSHLADVASIEPYGEGRFQGIIASTQSTYLTLDVVPFSGGFAKYADLFEGDPNSIGTILFVDVPGYDLSAIKLREKGDSRREILFNSPT